MNEEYHHSRAAVPLQVWGLVLLLLCSAALTYLAALPWIHQELMQKVQARLSAQRRGPLVLILGNSLSCAAVNPGYRQLADGTVADIRVLPFQLTRLLTMAETRQLAMALKAELLLVQADFLFTADDYRALNSERMHVAYQYLLADRADDMTECRRLLEPQVALSSAFLQGLVTKYAQPDAKPNYSSVSDIVSLQAEHLKVALIRVPRAKSFEAALSYVVRNRHDLETRFAAEKMPLYVPELATWPDEYFRDFRHMNEVGSEQYTQWLARALLPLLAPAQ